MEFINALVDLSNAMSPYILFGLLIAGILNELIPDDFIKKHLGNSNFFSVIKATLFGVPIPVCSCGVIPLATSLKKSGASKGSVLSFLISTPITGIDSILATYGIFGFSFTIYRIISSIFIALSAGVLVNYFDEDKKDFKKVEEESNCSCSSCGCETKKKKIFSITSALKYGFITLLADIAKPLFWGLVIGALITVLMPKDLSIFLNEYPVLSYVIAVAVALPMYVCATASLPIAAALVLNGVNLGAAFVFLTAGPATNTITIGVVKNILGKKAVIIYLSVIAVGSIIFGLLLDIMFSGVDVKKIVHIEEDAGIISIASSIILWSFVIYFIVKEKLVKKSCCNT